MNIYERAKERFDSQVAYRQSYEKQQQIRYEWEIDSLIQELPYLIPDGLDWHWDGSDSFVNSHRNGVPTMKLSIGDYEIKTIEISPVWNSDKLTLKVGYWDYEYEHMVYDTITSADDSRWLSSPIFDCIYEYVRMTESNKG